MAGWVKEDIDAGKALSKAPLPGWVFEGPVATNSGVHTAQGSWSSSRKAYVPRSELPVYARQHFAESVLGAGAAAPLNSGTQVFKNDEVRVWTLDGEVLIASITAKLHLISGTVTEGLLKAVEIAEQGYKGLVIWSPDDVFSAGANLESMMPVFMKLGAKGIAPEEKKLQDMMLRLRYAQVPVVAAMRGLALGGGCEIAVHCARRVATMETYVGLVEVGVGLIPGGGGLAYIARRAAEMANAANANADIMKFAMMGVARDLREKSMASRMLLQVHDELVFEVAPGEFDALSGLVRHRMGSAADLRVPLDVQIGSGSNWDAAAH